MQGATVCLGPCSCFLWADTWYPAPFEYFVRLSPKCWGQRENLNSETMSLSWGSAQSCGIMEPWGTGLMQGPREPKRGHGRLWMSGSEPHPSLPGRVDVKWHDDIWAEPGLGLGMEHAWHAEGEEGMRAEGPACKDPKRPAKGRGCHPVGSVSESRTASWSGAQSQI